MSGHDDGRTGCPPFLLPPDCTMTYASFLGTSFTVVHIIYAIVVLGGLVFTCFFGYRALKAKGFNPRQSVQVRLHLFILIGMLLLAARIIDPFGWSRRIPFQLILLSYDLSGTMTLSIGLDIVFDWIKVVRIADTSSQLNSSERFRFISIAFQVSTGLVLMILSVLQCTVGPWWLFHSLKTAVYMLVCGAMLALLVKYGFRIQTIIKAHEDLHSRHTIDEADMNDDEYEPPSTNGTVQSVLQVGSPYQHSLAQNNANGYSGNGSESYSTNIDMLSSGNQNHRDPTAYHNLQYPSGGAEDHIFKPLHQTASSESIDSSGSFVSGNRDQSSLLASSPSQSTLVPPPTTRRPAPKKKASAGAKVPKLIIIIILLLALMIVLWAYVLYNEIYHQCTIQNSCNLVKDGNISLLSAALYDAVHLFAYASICLFFGMQKDEAKAKQQAKDKRSKKITTVGTRSYVVFNDGSRREATQAEVQQDAVYDQDPNSIGKPTTRSLFPKSALFTHHSAPRSHHRSALASSYGRDSPGAVSLQTTASFPQNNAIPEGEEEVPAVQLGLEQQPQQTSTIPAQASENQHLVLVESSQQPIIRNNSTHTPHLKSAVNSHQSGRFSIIDMDTKDGQPMSGLGQQIQVQQLYQQQQQQHHHQQQANDGQDYGYY